VIAKIKAAWLWCWSRRKACWLWCWSHRTKAVGGIGMAAAYAYEHQEQLGLFIPAKSMGHTMMAIGILTTAVGLYNTFFNKDVVRERD
jgi:hypothetical protein